MKIKIKNDFCIVPIDSEKKLYESLFFLKKEFNWSKKYFKTFFKNITNTNYKQYNFGYFLEKNDDIYGVLIFVNQTFENDINNIVNLSSWYMKKEVRGIISMIF